MGYQCLCGQEYIKKKHPGIKNEVPGREKEKKGKEKDGKGNSGSH